MANELLTLWVAEDTNQLSRREPEQNNEEAADEDLTEDAEIPDSTPHIKGD